MALTAKQQRFVEEYLLDLNATQAAIRAGYSAKTVRKNVARLKAHEGVWEAIRAAQDERTERTEIDADYVLKGLKGEAEYAGEGASHSARVQAYHLLGKHVGMFADKVKLEHSGEIATRRVDLSKLTDDQLAAIEAAVAPALAAATGGDGE